MRYIRDRTGRFPQRPHYEARELDEECERIITQFMKESCGSFVLPIPTEALTKLIERDAADLDLYADLTSEGADVQGLTNFYPARRARSAYCCGALRIDLREPASDNTHARIWPREVPRLPLANGRAQPHDARTIVAAAVAEMQTRQDPGRV